MKKACEGEKNLFFSIKVNNLSKSRMERNNRSKKLTQPKEEIKYQILQKINSLNLLHTKLRDGINRENWFRIAFASLLIIFDAVYNLLYKSSLFEKPPHFDEALLFPSVLGILSSIYVLRLKRNYYQSKNLDALNLNELKIELDKVSKIEENALRRNTSLIAMPISLLLSLVLAIATTFILHYFKTKQWVLFEAKGGSNSFYFYLGFVYIIFIGPIAQIVGAPMTPRKYYKEKEKLSNKLAFSFLSHLDNSILNPIKTVKQ